MNINFRRGLDLKIKGGITNSAPVKTIAPLSIAIVPDDFPGFTAKLDVKPGDTVTTGQPLMHDKVFPDINIVSPVSGTIKDVVRGERRKILRVVVDTATEQSEPKKVNIDTSSAESIKQTMMQGGVWALMRQRPYDIVPQPEVIPVNIFVTAFDSAPLAPELSAEVVERDAEINAGLKALASLTTGKVYVGVRASNQRTLPAEIERVEISGPHPAGNAGVQASAIAPVNKGEVIWTMDIVTVARIGALLLTGTAFWSTRVAITGPDVITPTAINTIIGADIDQLTSGNITDTSKHKRIISGNILTGHKVNKDGYLRYPYRQITVMDEGDDIDEFMGWASLSPKKMSTSRSFFSWLTPNKSYAPDARLLGGKRSMIMSGLYDKVMPMDIIPEYLIKAILSGDIDRMEALGIYEVAPEDFALCEYIDPSKLELQKIVRQGLDYLRKELA